MKTVTIQISQQWYIVWSGTLLYASLCSTLHNDSISGHWRSWSDCADAQSDQDLRCPHMPEDTLSHGTAHIQFSLKGILTHMRPANAQINLRIRAVWPVFASVSRKHLFFLEAKRESLAQIWLLHMLHLVFVCVKVLFCLTWLIWFPLLPGITMTRDSYCLPAGAKCFGATRLFVLLIASVACWVKISADDNLKFLFYFSQKIGFDISCKLSP